MVLGNRSIAIVIFIIAALVFCIIYKMLDRRPSGRECTAMKVFVLAGIGINMLFHVHILGCYLSEIVIAIGLAFLLTSFISRKNGQHPSEDVNGTSTDGQ